jgi:hypothetical protein
MEQQIFGITPENTNISSVVEDEILCRGRGWKQPQNGYLNQEVG